MWKARGDDQLDQRVLGVLALSVPTVVAARYSNAGPQEAPSRARVAAITPALSGPGDPCALKA
ncbi:hypothetical protein GCM10020220_005250 [Nonomuraea rubra]